MSKKTIAAAIAVGVAVRAYCINSPYLGDGELSIMLNIFAVLYVFVIAYIIYLVKEFKEDKKEDKKSRDKRKKIVLHDCEWETFLKEYFEEGKEEKENNPKIIKTDYKPSENK